MMPDRWWSPRANWTERAGYPWQPCELQAPDIVTLKKQWKQRMLVACLLWRKGGRVGREKSLTRSLQQRKTSGMTWHPKQSCKNNEYYALARSPRPSCTPPWGRLLTSSLVLRLTLPKLHLATFSNDFDLGRFWMVWAEYWCNYISSH